MKQTHVIALIVLVSAGIGFWLFTRDTAEAPTTLPPSDAAVPRPTPADATDTTTEPLAPGTDYLGLTETDAGALAESNGVPFRVVERDGEMLPTTRDYRPGRVNAVVEAGLVTSYTIEGTEMDKGGSAPSESSEDNGSGSTIGAHDAIIGMTQAEAEAYANANGVPFRLGSIDGEALPVTMDYRPGRITASIVDGVVTTYSVE